MSPSQIDFSILLNMSQPSLEEIIKDEQLLSIVLGVELEDAEKTLAQIKLEKHKPTHSGPYSLNMDYYMRKIFKEWIVLIPDYKK